MSEDNPLPKTRVVKRFTPRQPGAIKLTQRFGPDLVCVRYRHDVTGAMRYTTVELIVEVVPVVRRTPRPPATKPHLKIVAVQLGNHEIDLRKLIIRHGGLWDGDKRLWYLTQASAESLKLVGRIV